jgi:cGMP-dependent protein kinase 1
MGSCNRKSLVNESVVSKVKLIGSSTQLKENLFTKPAEESILANKLLVPSQFPRRSSLCAPESVESVQVRRGSFSGPAKRGSVSGEVPKTAQDLKIIKTALLKHFIFSTLTESQIDAVANEMFNFSYPAQKIIFEQNSQGDNFFIISKGKVEVVVNLKVAAILNVGDSFGEVALLHDTPRTATIITLQETILWGLDRNTFREILKSMSSKNFNENLVFIENIQIFASLTKKQKESLANAMVSEVYKVGFRIIQEDERGDFMYIIKEGSVLVTKKGMEIRKLGKNDYFGEQALLNNNLRTATITALENVCCLSISSEGLYSAFGSHLQEIIHLNTQRMALDKNPILSELTADQINQIVIKTKVIRHKRGGVVLSGGFLLENLYIVLSGCIGNRISKIKPLDIYGYQEMLTGPKTMLETLAAIEDSDVAEINKTEFEQAIGGRLRDVIERNHVFKIMKNVNIFQRLDNQTLEKIVRIVNIVKFRNKENIFTQNQPGDSFFIVKTGNVEVIKNGNFIRNISKYDYFGERSLIFNKNRTATVRALGDIECWSLTRAQFAKVFDDEMKKQLLERIELQDDKIEMADLCIVNLIHTGRVSNIFICVNKTNSKLYLLKSMVRANIVNSKLEVSVVMQKKILSQLEHNLIVKLIKTFKDSKRLCYLLEYVKGINFENALQSLKKPDELDSRFYTGCFILMLEYLHQHDIIYRDLNIKNLVIDMQGYPKLVDFSCAKYIQGRTYTLIGTPHYVAPEVITGHGYGIAADYWSLGITLYRIMYGTLPFGNKETDPVRIYQNIINNRVIFPNWVDPLSKSRDFLGIILNKNPAQRTTIDKIKTHPWFVGLNWELLHNKQLKAPFLPVPKDYNEEFKVAIKQEKYAEDILPKFEEGSDMYIPRFNVNSKWDAEF